MTPWRPRAQFGSSGIRGGLDRVDTELAIRLGRVLGADHPHVVIGHDARLSGGALQNALIAGLLASGAQVDDAGLLPTPALAHAARARDLGIMVTASHNPPPDNGFKLITPQGTAPLPQVVNQIHERLGDPPAPRAWDQTGTLREAPEHREDYVEAVLKDIAGKGFEEGTLDGIRIGIDCAHGAGATVTPRLLSRLGAGLTVIGGTPDGRFPDHPSEPTPDHLTRLRRVLGDGEHALGIAHDGDADRTVFLTPQGEIIRSEQLLVVMARRRGDERIVVPVDAGGLLAKALPSARIVVTPVGDVHLSQAILEARASLGAEPSGTWFLGDWSPAPEGPYMAALVAAHLAHDPDLVKEAAGLPMPARAVRKIPLDENVRMDRLLQQVTNGLNERIEPIHVITIDGARFETENGWVLVRASGTEPLVRVTAEADSTDEAERLAQEAANRVHEAKTATTSGRT